MQGVVDVAIVGAGPYGLSLAAHLRARGVRHRICGEAMRFWRDMPVGINLKSFAFATNIAVPERGNSFPDWCRRHGLEDYEPCTMQSFAAYGMEMREQFVPEIEEVLATNIATNGKEFEVTLANNDSIRARRVVVCTGLSNLNRVPRHLQGLGPDLLRHTADISEYSAYRQKRVAIIGAGASAIEAGALVNEAGGAAGRSSCGVGTRSSTDERRRSGHCGERSRSPYQCWVSVARVGCCNTFPCWSILCRRSDVCGSPKDIWDLRPLGGSRIAWSARSRYTFSMRWCVLIP